MKKIKKGAKQSHRGRDTSTIHQHGIALSTPFYPPHKKNSPLTTTNRPVSALVSAIVWGLAVAPVYADQAADAVQRHDAQITHAAHTTEEKHVALNNPTPRDESDMKIASRTVASFDIDTLKARGFDPQIANYFSQAPRFREGRQVVTLLVNGQKRGLVNAQFDHESALCLSLDLFNQANLVPPRGIKESSGNAAAQTNCLNAHPDLKNTIIELYPQRSEVSLIVSTDRLGSVDVKPENYKTGGTAGLINYDLFNTNYQYKNGSNRYFSAATEAGFNMGNWIVRSRQNYQRNNDRNTFTHLYAYAQKTFADYGTTFQAGQLNTAQSVFSGVPITGVQLFPETSFSKISSGTTQVDGIAQTQARIEVRQIGALIYSTLVPSGPFSLKNIPLLSSGSDLDVTVIENDGRQHTFVVPAASIQNAELNRPGYSFALGKIRNVGNTSNDKSWVTTATGVWPIARDTTATAGLMAATAYQSLGGGADWRLKKTTFSWRSTLSNAQREKVRGIRSSLSINAALKESLWASFSTMQQTPGYRDPLDTQPQEQSALTIRRYQGQYTAALGWTNLVLGGFNLSYTYATSRSATEVAPPSKRLTGTWSKTFSRASVSLNLEKNFTSADSSRINGDAVYLSVYIPLGSSGNVRSYMNHRDHQTRFGTTFNDQINEYASYSIQAEYDKQSEQTDVSGNLSLLPRYTQINLGYTRSGSDTQSYRGQLTGGIALHQRGITFSPYAVQDTFGILSVGDVSGVKVNTPNGPVWTDRWGKAVVSQFPAYRNGQLEVATKTLPRNIDLANGVKTVEAGRGSVNHVDFDVVKVRRALLLATDHQGQPLAKGASVIRADNSFVTVVGPNGQIFLTNNQLGEKLRVALSDTTSCELKFTLPEKADTQAYYEKIHATCQSSKTLNKKAK